MAHSIPFIDEAPGMRERLARAKVLYTDLDGTLLGQGNSLLTDSHGRPCLDAAEGIVALNAAGLRVVITSGRGAKQLVEVTRLLGWRDYIAELGTVRAYDRGSRVVYDIPGWPPDALHEGETPHEAITRAGALDVLREHFPGRIEEHDPWHREREVTHVLRGNVPLAEAQPLLDRLELPVALIDNGVIHPPRTTLSGVDEVHAFHLVPKGASKARGITLDLEEHGLDAGEALAIGDSHADIGMADAVGTMVVVANGLDDQVLVAEAERRGDIFATRASRGSGWRELADAWIAARASA